MNISKNFLNKEELKIIDTEILQNTFPKHVYKTTY